MKSPNELLRDMHATLIQKHLDKLNKPVEELTAADLNAAAKFLKDNDITVIMEGNSVMTELEAQLTKRSALRDESNQQRLALLSAKDKEDLKDNVLSFSKGM